MSRNVSPFITDIITALTNTSVIAAKNTFPPARCKRPPLGVTIASKPLSRESVPLAMCKIKVAENNFSIKNRFCKVGALFCRDKMQGADGKGDGVNGKANYSFCRISSCKLRDTGSHSCVCASCNLYPWALPLMLFTWSRFTRKVR